MKYSVCFTDKDGFDWCIVNDFDNAVLYGVGNLPTMADIVEAANRWRDYVEAQPAAPALLAIAEMVNDKIIPEIEDFAGPSGIIHVPLTRAEVEAIRAAIAAAEGER